MHCFRALQRTVAREAFAFCIVRAEKQILREANITMQPFVRCTHRYYKVFVKFIKYYRLLAIKVL